LTSTEEESVELNGEINTSLETVKSNMLASKSKPSTKIEEPSEEEDEDDDLPF
jgi:hypothetical protein